MSKHLILFILAVALVAPAAASAQTADRWPGVYQFAPLPNGYCADRQRQDFNQLGHRWSLGSLPSAYLILLKAKPAAATESGRGPAYDPCAKPGPALVRVR